MTDDTSLLDDAAPRGSEDLDPLLYGELRALAADSMRPRERPGHTLQPTALMREAWMRISGQDDSRRRNHERLFALDASGND